MSVDYQNDLRRLGQFITQPDATQCTPQLYAAAMQHKVAGYILEIMENRLGSTPSDPALEELANTARTNGWKIIVQDNEMQAINRLLNDHNIRPIWIKGAALAHTIYGNPLLRSRTDLDFIVKEDDFGRAHEHLLESGYFDIKGEKLETGLDSLDHHIVLRSKRYNSVVVELHRALLGNAFFKEIPPKTLARWLQDTLIFSINGDTYHTLQPEIHLVYLSAHTMLQHGLKHIIFRNLLDIHLLIQTYPMNWDIIAKEASNLKWVHLVRSNLDLVDDCFGEHYTDRLESSLMDVPGFTEDADRTFLMSHRDTSGELVIRQLQQLNWKDRITAIYRIALPSRSYMRMRYDIPQDRSTAPYYFGRWFRQAKGLAKALFRRLNLLITSNRDG
ncbi:MAG: nucleotidyltransferase family protein [Anaerolineaceae bacterium]|nr:nucleotidyltransferase family protein [Anaerolineaceae bacterium]